MNRLFLGQSAVRLALNPAALATTAAMALAP
jgi:hypothetical protein